MRYQVYSDRLGKDSGFDDYDAAETFFAQEASDANFAIMVETGCSGDAILFDNNVNGKFF